MKAKILLLPVLMLSVVLLFTACQKEGRGDKDFTNEISTHSDDQSRFASEIDASANDADLVLETTSTFSGRGGQTQSLICDASVEFDTVSNPRTITITYNGTNCIGNRTRTGTIVISMAQAVRWKNAGAAIMITFQNLRITRLSDNKSITISGSQTYTNQSGGLLINLVALGSITHTITSSNLSVTFDDGTQRSWQVAKQRVFTYNNGVVITGTGTHTQGTLTGIAEWGTNRFGNTFTTSTFMPIVVRQDCGFRITSGEVRHNTQFVNSAARFGLDSNGNPTPCPGPGNYYMKITWTGAGGNTYSTILPY
jgi:hypothetical protein